MLGADKRQATFTCASVLLNKMIKSFVREPSRHFRKYLELLLESISLTDTAEC